MASKELEQVLEIMRSRPVPEEPPTIQEMRDGMEAAPQFPLEEDVRCEATSILGIPGEWISTPESEEDRVLYYLHGGGYVMGSVNTHRVMISHLARATKARALAIDYRLAPENPFPAAIADATAVYRWLLATNNPKKMVVAGDSAGGGLTMATLLALRDAGDPLPAAGVCISPWVDMEGLGESMTTKADIDPMVGKDGIVQMGKTYLGDEDPRAPLASPIYADLTGLPSLLIQVGTAETLLDDSTRLAAKGKEAGVDVTLETWDDMIHVWHSYAPMLPEGQQAIDRIGEFVSKHTG